MSVLGKDLFDFQRSHTNTKVEFGASGYWVEMVPEMQPYCRLTSFSRSLQINLRINLDGTIKSAHPIEMYRSNKLGIKEKISRGKFPRLIFFVPCTDRSAP